MSVTCNAQSIVSSVVACGGNFLSKSTGSVSLTLGQPLAGDISTATNRLHVGFQVAYVSGTITGLEDEVAVFVFPNPVVNQLHIQAATNDKLSFQLLDMQGRELKVSHDKTSDGVILYMDSLSPAVYVLRIRDEQGRLRSTAVVKSN